LFLVVGWFAADVSGQGIDAIFKVQDVQEENLPFMYILTFEDGTNTLFRNVGDNPTYEVQKPRSA
jgi:hypothetical protein